MNTNEVSVSVFLPQGAAPLPAGSTITVELQDVSKLDAPATTLARTVVPLPAGWTSPYKYLFTNVQLGQAVDVVVSAVLNVGWSPSGDEWIRHGDYLTDIPTSLQLPPTGPTITASLYLTQYQ